jgi:hypothetical protein
MIFHRIVIQLLDSEHNKAAIDQLMPRLPELLGPVHGPFDIIKQERVEIIEAARTESPTSKKP